MQLVSSSLFLTKTPYRPCADTLLLPVVNNGPMQQIINSKVRMNRMNLKSNLFLQRPFIS